MACTQSEAYWAASELQAMDVQSVLESDIDSAGTIVKWWFDRAEKRFEEFGRKIRAASSKAGARATT